jgi:hypothetical protein
MKKTIFGVFVLTILLSTSLASAGWFEDIFLSPCNDYDHLGCYNGDVYWFNSCNNAQQNNKVVECGLLRVVVLNVAAQIQCLHPIQLV